MISRIVLPVLFVFSLCLAPLAHGQNNFPKPKPRATPVHHHTVIESISADSITVSAADGEKTYKITKDTEITFKGETTTADQLQAGMRVQVMPDAADDSIAGQITANDPPKDPSPTPKK